MVLRATSWSEWAHPARQATVLGLGLGLLLSIGAVLTNVIFPRPNISDDDYAWLILLIYVGMFFLFGVAGYRTSGPLASLRGGALGGALTALLALGMTILTYIVIDTVFFDVVSKQVDKVVAFQQQTHFHNIREFINDGNRRAVLFGLPVALVLGMALGAIGASVRKLQLGKWQADTEKPRT